MFNLSYIQTSPYAIDVRHSVNLLLLPFVNGCYSVALVVVSILLDLPYTL